MGKQFRVKKTEMTVYPVTRVPDVLPEEIAGHLASLLGISAGPDFTAIARGHLLAHVRGDFKDGIHFHYQPDAEGEG